MSFRNQSFNRLPEPAKKSKAPLIIGIIIAVIVVIAIVVVIIILLTRGSTTTPPPTPTPTPPIALICTTDSDCAGAEVCNTTLNICVECVDNTTCDGETPICKTLSGNCVECVGDGDCPGSEVCTTSGVCVKCINNGDCLENETCSGGLCVCPVPVVPLLTVVHYVGGGVQVSWNAVTGATAYNFIVDNPPGDPAPATQYTVNGVVGTSTTLVDTGNLIPIWCHGDTLGARIQAVSPCGNSIFSARKNVDNLQDVPCS